MAAPQQQEQKPSWLKRLVARSGLKLSLPIILLMFKYVVMGLFVTAGISQNLLALSQLCSDECGRSKMHI